MRREHLAYTDGAVLFVADKVGSYSGDEAELLDGRFMNGGEKVDTVRG